MKSTIELLRDLRSDHDLSQTDVAKILGISQQHYSKYETGEYDLPLHHFSTLAEYYHVSADYLLGKCSFHAKKELDTIFITKDTSASVFLNNLLSLDDDGRKALTDHLELLKLKQSIKE